MTKNIGFSNIFRLLGLVLFIYILSQVNFPQLIALFRQMDYSYYLLGLCFLIPGLLVRILRLKILLNAATINIPFKSMGAILLKGIFLGVVTPGRLGELWQAKYLTDVSGAPIGKGLYAVLMDRIIDIIVVITIAMIASLSLSLFEPTKTVTIIISMLLIFVIVTGYFLLKRRYARGLIGTITEVFIPQFLKEKVKFFGNEFFKSLRELNRKTFIKALGCGFLYYLVAVFIYYFMALSLKIPIPFWFLFLIVSIIWLILMVPVTVLGLGTREASYILLFSLLGVSSSQAVAFSLLILSVNIVSSIPGAILFLIK